MEIIGIIKQMPDSPQYEYRQDIEENRIAGDLNYDIPARVPQKVWRTRTFVWHFPDLGRVTIAPADKITRDLLTASVDYQNKYYTLQNTYSDYKRKVENLLFFKRLYFLFTRKIK